MGKRHPKQRIAAEKYFDEIVELISGGMSGMQACESNKDFPRYRALTGYARQSGKSHLIKNAWKAREAGPNARSKSGTKYTDEQYDQVIAIIQSNPSKSERLIYATLVPAGLPNRLAVNARRRREKAFAERFAAMQSLRPAIAPEQQCLNLIRRYDEVSPRQMLMASVARDDLYRRALFTFNIKNYEDLEDLIMDGVVALLEKREISRKDLMKAHYAKSREKVLTFSGDENVYENSDRTRTTRFETIGNHPWDGAAV